MHSMSSFFIIVMQSSMKIIAPTFSNGPHYVLANISFTDDPNNPDTFNKLIDLFTVI